MNTNTRNPMLDRREFFYRASLLPLLLTAGSCKSPQNAAAPPLVDIHIHLFGTGDSGSGCMVSEKLMKYPSTAFLIHWLAPKSGECLDDAYRRLLLAHLQEAGLDRGVILAQDATYDRKGFLDKARTHLYVPNSYLLDVCGRHPDLMIPCVSINPDRRDRMEELDRCAERGARILKIHPPIQGVDVSDRKHTPFFDRCRELGIIVMVHTGHEHSAPVIDSDLADPRRLSLALDVGCTVVASHAGTGRPTDKTDMLPHFLEMLGRYKRLWGDTSVLCAMHRRRDLLRLRDAGVVERLVHGSDFPFPALPLQFKAELGEERARDLAGERNLLKRDLLLKAALGFVGTARRTGNLLNNAGRKRRS